MASSRGAGFPFGDPVARASQSGGQVADAAGGSPTRRNDDSWVEISSQPSSSSLSSIGDDAANAGIRNGGHSAYAQRRRRLLQLSQQQHQRQSASSPVLVHAPTPQQGTSSQEEYDETESEEDRVMAGSTDNVQSSSFTLQRQAAFKAAGQTATSAQDESEDDDDDENATALGNPGSAPAFRPQPNVFSHPPSHLTHRHSTSSSVPQHPHFGRPSLSARSQARATRAHSNYLSPAYQADNDAALRASLTTLLSCAAAARGLPKKETLDNGEPSFGTGVRPSATPMDFRVVSEAELMASNPAGPSQPAVAAIHAGPLSGKSGPVTRMPAGTASNSSAPSAPSSSSSNEAGEKAKRGASTQQQSKQRAAKKKRTGASSSAAVGLDSEPAAAFISPTLLTWVVSAGVLVLVSVVGFGAGYVIGREVGRQEGGAAFSAAQAGRNVSGSCGSEVVRSGGSSGGALRKFRWGDAVKSVTA